MIFQKIPKKFVYWTGGTVLAILLIYKLCFVKVALDEVGVKVDNIAGGIVEQDFEPGFHFVFPFVHSMHIMDPTIQAFHMRDDKTADTPALKLVGKDQYSTRFDVTILFRIAGGKAYKIATKVGTTPQKAREVLRSKAEKALWDALGRLDTQEFYDVARRERARADAKVLLQKELEPLYLELVDVLIRDIKYDPNLENILVRKQLIDQQREYTVEKAKLERELEKTQAIEQEAAAKVRVIEEEMTQEVANIEAETDARINEITADADLTAKSLLAEADLDRRRKIAQGELAKTVAEAKGEKAVNEAYTVPGAQFLLTRKMVDSLSFGPIEINTNDVNPFDVDQLLRMLGLTTTTTDKD